MISIILDAAVILILVIALIVGLSRGFLKSIWNFISLAIFIVCIYFTAAPAAKLVESKTGLDTAIETALVKPIGKLTGSNTLVASGDKEAAKIALTESGFPSAFRGLVIPMIGKYVPEGQTMAIKTVAAKGLASYAIMSGVVLVLMVLYGIILYAILFRLIKKLIDKFIKLIFIKPADKILGMVFQTALAAVILIALGGVANTMRDIKFMKAVNNAYPSTKAFKYIYGENPVQNIFDSKVNLGDKLGNFGLK